MKVLIAEDEAPAARRLERMVADHLGARRPCIELAATVEAAREQLAAQAFDLLLLDLDLNGADGFTLIGWGATRPRIVVVSARADRAIDAFDHAVADFVTKPVSAARLAKALDRALAPGLSMRGPASLVVRSAGRIDLASFGDIVALSGADDYVEVVLADGRRFLHDTRLQELEQRLPPGFIRVHRSHIANTAHIRSVRTLPGARRALLLSGGTEIPVSRGRVDAVRTLLAR
jgi:two-component system, LytTR family, response regulator LytT